MPMKTAGIRELKNRLSAYVREVERGETVLVTDRGRIVAELRPPGAADRGATAPELRHRQLVDEGVLRPATAPRTLRLTGRVQRRLARGTAQELLDEDRAE